MKRFAIILLGFVLIFTTLRFLLNTTFFPIHDFTHVTRLVEMDRALNDGEFPVRWSKNLGYGYGMPLFNFYGPMPFYVAEAFHNIGLNYLFSIKAMVFFMTGVAFVGMYLLAAEYFGALGGTVAAAAFLLMPYRAVDLFVRGAFNELFAISLVSFIMYGFIRISREKSWFWTAITAASFMAFFTSHNLMTLMFFPCIYLFALLQIWAKGVKKRTYFIRMHAAILLSVGLAAFYLFPSFFEKGWTQVDKLIGGYGAYAYHFLYIRQLFIEHWGYGGSILGIEDGISFHLGWVHVALATIGVVGWSLRAKTWHQRIMCWFFAVSLAISLFMTIFKSQFIWDRIPILVYFQFPWRFLSVAAVLVPLLAGAAVYAIPKSFPRKSIIFVAIILLLLTNLRFFQPQKLLENPDDQYYDDPKRIQSQMSSILPDYIPIWMKKIQEPFQQPFEILGNKSQQINVLVDRTQEKLLQFTLTKPDILLLHMAWFPNWTVYDNGVRVDHKVDNTTSFFSVQLGAGDHLISVKFEDTQLRTWTNIVSGMSAVIVIGVLGYAQHRRRSA